MFELFVARRYLKAKHSINLISIISVLSTIGITIGVAALVLVLSVFNGFGNLVTSRLTNFDPHLRIDARSPEAFTHIDSVESVITGMDDIVHAYPYAEGKVIILKNNSYEVVNMKGVVEHKTEDDEWGVANRIISGGFDLSNDDGSQIVLGIPNALRLSSRVGDTIVVTSFSNIEKVAVSLAMPQTRAYRVAGVFETNNKEYDYGYVFTSLRSAQAILGLHNQFTGYELRLSDMGKAESVKRKLEKSIDTGLFTVNTWFDLHKDLYTVMLLERWAAYIILALIIAVATFNILGSLTMTVIEKRKDIGVLRSMGTTGKSVLKIFMYEGLLIGVIGTVAGLALGLLLCFIQIKFNVYPLDASKYIIDYLPLEVQFTDIIAVSAVSLFLSYIASLYPAKKAAKANVTESLKWE